MLVFIFLNILLFFASAETVSNQEKCVKVNPRQSCGEVNHWESKPSPFYSCSVRKSSTNHEKVGFLQRSVPAEDKRGIKTKDFLLELANRVQQAGENNLKMTENLNKCMSSAFKDYQTTNCKDLRSWAIDKDYNNPESLAYNIKAARANLALATSSTPTSLGICDLNSKLKTHESYKFTDWAPLNKDESLQFEKVLMSYQNKFLSKKNLSLDQMKELCEPSVSNYSTPLRREFVQMMHEVRRKHMEEYRKIVSKFPIINYMSLSAPTEGEIYGAGLRMQVNAKNELEKIRNWKKLIESSSDENIPAGALDLLDYRGLVEGLLTERQEFCAVATSTELARDSRELSNAILLTAPLLAATFLAPPLLATFVSPLLTGAVVGGLSTTAYTSMSYIDYQDQKQAFGASVINDGSMRSDLKTVERARSDLNYNLMMIPVGSVIGGSAPSVVKSVFKKTP